MNIISHLHTQKYLIFPMEIDDLSVKLLCVVALLKVIAAVRICENYRVCLISSIALIIHEFMNFNR